MNIYEEIATELADKKWTGKGPNTRTGGPICLSMAIDNVKIRHDDTTYAELYNTITQRLPRLEGCNGCCRYKMAGAVIHWNDRHATEEQVFTLLAELAEEEGRVA
jgi:hypothetical protein